MYLIDFKQKDWSLTYSPFLSAIKKRLRALFLRREKEERDLDKKGSVTGGDDAQDDSPSGPLEG